MDRQALHNFFRLHLFALLSLDLIGDQNGLDTKLFCIPLDILDYSTLDKQDSLCNLHCIGMKLVLGLDLRHHIVLGNFRQPNIPPP